MARRNQYNYGNTAEQYHEYRLRMEEPVERMDPTVRKNQEKARHMNLPYVLFLSIAFVAVAMSAIMMIRAQENIKESVNNVSELENQYVTLKADNDATYDRIVNSVDAAEVKRIATEELGMHYAAEGQIVVYAGDMDDYVRQYADIR